MVERQGAVLTASLIPLDATISEIALEEATVDLHACHDSYDTDWVEWKGDVLLAV